MPDLTREQIRTLERLKEMGFELIVFPLFANYIGVKKGNCAALLGQSGAGKLEVFGEPGYLVAGNISVLVRRGAARYFVWKQDEIEATAERLAELERFVAELRTLL